MAESTTCNGEQHHWALLDTELLEGSGYDESAVKRINGPVLVAQVLIFASLALYALDQPQRNNLEKEEEDHRVPIMMKIPSPNANGGDIVHYDCAKMAVPREEAVKYVTDALAGNDVAAVEYSNEEGNLVLLELNRDGMELSELKEDGFSGSFTVTNNFVMEDPDTYFKVSCPDENSGNECNVSEDGGGSTEIGNYLKAGRSGCHNLSHCVVS